MRAASACAIAAMTLVGCGEAETPLTFDPAALEITGDEDGIAELDEFLAAEHSYVGAVDDDLLVGVALDADPAGGDPHDVLVYFCNDDDVVVYLTGVVGEDGAVEFDWASGELPGDVDVGLGETVELSLALDAQTATGEVTFDGAAHRFDATAADGSEGLYVACSSEDCHAWIVVDGDVRGGTSSSTDVRRTLDAVLDTITETVKSGEKVTLSGK